MWRIFRWLDRREPNLYKFTVMAASLAAIVGLGFLLARLHPAAGILFAFGSIFALMRASHVYRFEKKQAEPPQRGLPISDASEGEILRRVRRSGNTEKLRRHILWLAAHERGKRGDQARVIVERWKASGMPEGKPVEPRSGDAN